MPLSDGCVSNRRTALTGRRLRIAVRRDVPATMDGPSIRDGVRIARTELRCHRRESGGRLRSGRTAWTLILAITLVSSTIAFASARVLASADPGTTGAAAGLVASAIFVALLWRSAFVTRERFERMNPEFLLTTVPTRAAAVGLLCYVFARAAIPLALPAVGVSLGAAAGFRSPGVAFTALASFAGVTVLAVAVGTASRLGARLVGTRFARGGFYRDLWIVFGWIPLMAAWFVLRETSLSLAPVLAWLDAQPVAWFGDLALLGAFDADLVAVPRALGATALLLAVPIAAGATTVFARRIWESEPADSGPVTGSRSLVGDGWLERLLGAHVPRPVLTVARERLLLERRVPRGLLSTGYVLLYVAVVLMPAFFLLGTATFLLVAVALGLAAGTAVAANPIEIEHRPLPMLVTTVGGRSFVGGTVLAATVVGVPVVAAVVIPLGLVGPVGVTATIGVALVGAAVCVCAASVAAAVGMTVDPDDVGPVPFFFTDVPVHAETGLAPFRRLATVFAIATLATVPAMLGNSVLVYEPATAAGVPTIVVRVGSLLATVALALGVAAVAFRTAVERYDAIRFD